MSDDGAPPAPSPSGAPTGATCVAAVIGTPIRHSLSPAIHNAAFRATGLDWTFVAFDVAAGDARRALDGMRALGIEGLSVTMPHKDAVAELVDELTPAAAALQAVNCVARRDGRLIGHNTDGEGFVTALGDACDVEVEGRRCVVLGAGGAARAIVAALARAGAADVVVVNRTPDKAQAAAALAGTVGRVGTPADVADAALLVNATSVGMGATEPDAPLPIDAGALHADLVVADIVMTPVVTPLLRAAEACGATAVDGVGMLVHQAAAAFEIWTGRSAPIPAMMRAARAQLVG